MSLLGKAHWGVLDCLTGKFTRVDKLPFEFGAADGVDLRLEGRGVAEKHCAISPRRGEGLSLVKRDADAELLVNGVPAEAEPLALDTDYSVKIGCHLLAVRGARDLEAWREGFDPKQWLLFDAQSGAPQGPMSPQELCRFARENALPPETIAAPRGLAMGFYLRQVVEVFEPLLRPAAPVEPPPRLALSAAGQAQDAPIASADGALTCPVCWLRFELGDLMHVAVHDSLRGDPMLGEDAQQRFHATRFNNLGQALDAFGLPCPDLACPHCRRVLPPGFTEIPHHILSMVGDQSAGKSYYLSVLVKLLPVRLYEKFGVVFQDSDPAGNALLNDMKKSLFSAQSPEQARLVKTQLEGIMYERLPRYGRTVALPRPFVFSLVAPADATRRLALIFYDNAGEHFQPGRDSADSPGAQHVASSSGIMFLFDPFNNPEFRQRIADHPDPQVEKPIVDQQDVILSELRVRLQRLLKLGVTEAVRTPLAVLIGKCDAWIHLLGPTPFKDPACGATLDCDALDYNSRVVRELMLDICPTIVANAETVSETVRYFPVSSFGHAPVRIGPGEYVPDPRRLKPLLVEIPPLWILSRINPGLVPTSRGSAGASTQ